MSKRKSSVAQARAMLDNIESDSSDTEGSILPAQIQKLMTPYFQKTRKPKVRVPVNIQTVILVLEVLHEIF
jgi:hypothetical protein